MLLDDEDTRAQTADRELLVSFDGNVLALDGGDVGTGRTAFQKGDQVAQLDRFALGVERERPVLGGANPAHDAELSRPRARRLAELDVLRVAMDDGAHRRATDAHRVTLRRSARPS